MARSALAGGFFALALIVLPGTAVAGSGAVILGRDGALWAWNQSGSDEPVLIRKLPGQGELSGLRVDASARHAVVRVGKVWHWVELATEVAERLDCTAQPEISPNGRCVLCRVSDRKSLLYAFGKQPKRHAVRGPGPSAFARGRAGDHVLVVEGGRLLKTAPRRRSFKNAFVAKHGPDSLAVAPTGSRAVGNFPKREGKAAGFYTFRVGKDGARRRLLGAAEAVAWSANGLWLLLQRDEAACLIRSVGGEYKCWDGYQAAALSEDGKEAFLIKDDGGKDLYRGLLEGVKASMPKRVLRNVATAAWVRAWPATPR